VAETAVALTRAAVVAVRALAGVAEIAGWTLARETVPASAWQAAELAVGLAGLTSPVVAVAAANLAVRIRGV
jgi:hypothetical protein